jgi:hypothetical protein
VDGTGGVPLAELLSASRLPVALLVREDLP